MLPGYPEEEKDLLPAFAWRVFSLWFLPVSSPIVLWFLYFTPVYLTQMLIKEYWAPLSSQLGTKDTGLSTVSPTRSCTEWLRLGGAAEESVRAVPNHL